MQIKVTSLLGFWLLVVLSVPVLAQEVFRLSIPEEAYPPYILPSKARTQSEGMLIDPLRKALSELGYSLFIEELPMARATYMLKKGDIDASMRSKEWVDGSEHYLWLDTGLWAADVLLYRQGLAKIPEELADLSQAEIIAHSGYGYPGLEALFTTQKLSRLDRHTESDMIDALQMAPKDSQRFVVINYDLWRWYQGQGLPYPDIKEVPFFVGCAQIQLQLANTAKMRDLLPKLQEVLQPNTAHRTYCQKNKE